MAHPSAHGAGPAPDGSTAGEAKAASLAACWSCHGPVDAGQPFCPSCGAVQPPGQIDHFQRLGLARDFDVDLTAMEKAYFDLQRQLHPDRFATKTAQEKAFSQQQATSLNDAYETLKDSLKRAIYLSGLMGMDVLKEGCNALTDPVILMEAMELREALAEATTPEDVAGITARAQGDIDDCEAELSRIFVAGDMEAMGTLITRLKYLRKLADESRYRRAQLRSDG